MTMFKKLEEDNLYAHVDRKERIFFYTSQLQENEVELEESLECTDGLYLIFGEDITGVEVIKKLNTCPWVGEKGMLWIPEANTQSQSWSYMSLT